MNTSRATSISLIVVCASFASPTLGQVGVGDDRVSLPDGPGSRDGLGDNASVNVNMGLMSTSVAIDVPAGFAGVTPNLTLSYSSGSGNSVLGLGWSMSVPFIERMTSRGYPTYDVDDTFVANGSEQLVRVSAAGAEPAVYRARFEGGFVRYSWHARGVGDEGYWTAEYPTGIVATFGADADGTLVDDAGVRSPGGIFRYLMTSVVDRFGHEATYDYVAAGSTSLLQQVSYVFTNGTPRYRVTVDYEQREDAQSDARGGFNEIIEDRIRAINVFSGNTRISRTLLDYEPYADAGGSSRLRRVQRFGKDGGLYPVVSAYEYSSALGSVCDDSDVRNCQAPFLVHMGQLGVNLQARTANLVDINGDSLPDVVDTTNVGQPMRIFLNRLAQDGTQDFDAPFNSSVLLDSSGFALDSPKVQMLDFNGDGFVDIVNQQLGRVLLNKGAGDWDSVQAVSGAGSLPDFGEFDPAQDGDLSNIRFLDFDGDRTIDILRTSTDRTEIFKNNGDGSGYSAVAGVMPLGAVNGITLDFATTPNLELADMNGDGLLDPTRVLAGRVDYFLNLGFGQWSDVQSVTGLPFTQQNDLDVLELEDINGDGLDDAVVVQGSTVRFAINRNGASFDAIQTITAAGAEPLPARLASTTVLYADMNGNGSNDIVWIEGASGDVTFLELFPVRPNLLTRATNGLGLFTETTYGTAAQQRAKATDLATQWPDPTPNQMIVVVSLDTYADNPDPALVQRDVTTYDYEAGFYDGKEKQFRGFSRVERSSLGDANQEGSHAVLHFDTGAGVDRAQMAGLLLREVVDDSDGPVQISSTTYELCPVDDVPTTGLDFPIRFVCARASETLLQNGAPPDQWANTRTEYTYDGYGNTTLVANLGVTEIGGAGCDACERDASVFGEPCGAQCLGDEAYEETDFISPNNTGGAWLTELVSEERGYGRPGSSVVATTRMFYDGAPFVGLAAGQATDGLLTRVAVQSTVGGQFDDDVRNAYDDNGNLIDTVSARGAIDGTAFHRLYTFSADGLNVLSEEKGVASDDGDYTLKRIYEYDTLFGGVARVTDWFIVGEPPQDDSSTLWAYDEFGRLSSTAKPGDTLAAPTEAYDYDYGNPRSKIRLRRSSVASGSLDLELVRCIDGFGRTTQTATRIGDNSYQVSGASTFNRRGEPVQIFQPFKTDAAGICASPPVGVVFDDITYDATGAEKSVVLADGSQFSGRASRTETRFGPLSVQASDEDDTDGDSASKDSPSVMIRDGLGRTVALERRLTATDTPQRYTITYDELGNLRGFVDPDGNEKIQTWDLAGHLLSISDPERGSMSFSYDADDNLVRSVDGNGTVTGAEYDSLGRKTAEFDVGDLDGTRIEYFFDRHPVCLPSTCTNGAGQLVGLRYPLGDQGEGLESYGYTARGAMNYSARTIAGQTFEFTIAYDHADRVVEQVFPGNQRIRYVYDGASRLIEIPGFINSATYDERGQLAETRFANGTTGTRTYDSRRRLSGIETKDAGGDAVVALALTRNRRGNLTRAADTSVGAAGLHNGVFGYDGFERLIRAELGLNGSANHDLIDIEFDALDRIVSKTSSRAVDSAEHVGAYSYRPDKPRAVASAGDVDFDYDDAGQAVTRGALSFDYDFLHRMTSVHRGNEELARSFYAPNGARVLTVQDGGSTWELASNFEVRDGVARLRLGLTPEATVEVQSAALMTQLLPDASGDGVINAADAFAAGVAGDGASADAVLRGSARRLLLDSAGTQTAYLALDHLGSTIAVTDAAGTVTERIAYHAFGSVRETSAGRTEYASFVGRDADESTGLIDLGARVYSPRDGRFLTPDGAFDEFSTGSIPALIDASGSYVYGANNPENYADTDGRFALGMTVGTALGLATGGISNVVGAVLGGIVALAVEVAKERKEGNFSQKTSVEKAQVVARIAVVVAVGAVSGFFSSGLSAVVAGAVGAVELRPRKGGEGGSGSDNGLLSGFVGAALGTALELGLTALDPALALNVGARVGLRVGTAALNPIGRYIKKNVPKAYRWAVKKYRNRASAKPAKSTSTRTLPAGALAKKGKK